MKFTKEEANKELVARMTARGEKLNLSERSINEQLETLIPLVANEETELSDFIDKTLTLFKTADANVRNDISAGINKYKADNPKTNPTSNPTPQTEEKSELEKRMEALELELSNAKREKKQADIRSNIHKALKDKGVKDEDWINAFLSEVNITEDFDVQAKVESYVSLYNKSKSDINPDVTPQNATNGSKRDILAETIKQAASFAKSQKLTE